MKCETVVTQIQGLEAQLTVGQEFILNCQGQWPTGIIPEQVSLLMPPEAKYVLQLRSFELRSLSEADLKVVSYTPGNVAIPEVRLSSNQGEISLGSVQFEVQSVMVQPEPGKQPEAFGPVGPALLGWPLAYTLLAVLLLGTVFVLAGSVFFRRWQRKRLLGELKINDSSLSPENQFYQTIRSLQRQNSLFYSDRANQSTESQSEAAAAIETLDQALKTYLTRQYHIPAFHWRPKLVCNDFVKQNRRHFTALSSQLEILLKEFYKIKKNQSFADVDALTLFKKTQKWVAEAELQRGKK
jgi:hypothetical protein